MAQLSNIKTINFNDKQITVKKYLSYAEIQAVCDAICKFDSWSERNENLDMLLLHFATDLTNDDLEVIGHEAFLNSGIIDYVKDYVVNFCKIEEAINYTQSTNRALVQILNKMPELIKEIQKVPQLGKIKKKE